MRQELACSDCGVTNKQLRQRRIPSCLRRGVFGDYVCNACNGVRLKEHYGVSCRSQLGNGAAARLQHEAARITGGLPTKRVPASPAPVPAPAPAPAPSGLRPSTPLAEHLPNLLIAGFDYSRLSADASIPLNLEGLPKALTYNGRNLLYLAVLILPSGREVPWYLGEQCGTSRLSSYFSSALEQGWMGPVKEPAKCAAWCNAQRNGGRFEMRIRLLPNDWDYERVTEEETAALFYADFISNKVQNVEYRFDPATFASLGMQPVPEWLLLKCFRGGSTQESAVLDSLAVRFGVFGGV